MVIDVRGQRYRLEGIIFDKDGTLIDFSHWGPLMAERARALGERFGLNGEAERELLAILGVDPATGHATSTIHRPREETERLSASFLSATLGVSEGEVLQTVREIFAEVDRRFPWEKHLRPTPGARELLSRIKDAGGIVAVVTHDSTTPARRHLLYAGLLEYVDLVVGADRFSARKPDPEGILYACRLLDLPPSGTAMVGDSREDVEAGKAAGCSAVIGVLTGKGGVGDLEGADHIIPDLRGIRVSAPFR
ncbi:HAD family hydrolase [Candidatus Bipolaricaulota bacterium]|nr:HAD family hydrolase [Candidatus Bipolaricaulota bacterium]